jgi:hypothetical protein
MSPTPVMLLVGLLVSAPALWAALVKETLPVDVAFTRVVVILLVVSFGGSALRGLVHAYTRTPLAPPADGAGGPTERRSTPRGPASKPSPPTP